MSCVWIALLLVFPSALALAQNKRIDSVEGPTLYKAHCAVCHGMDAKGSGPLAKHLKVTPPNLTLLASRNHGTFPLNLVRKMISGEAEVPAGHGSSLMPVWGPVFSQVDADRDLGHLRIYNLALYLKSQQKQ